MEVATTHIYLNTNGSSRVTVFLPDSVQRVAVV